MPFCKKAAIECPVVRNLNDLYHGTLHQDNIGPNSLINEISIGEVSRIVATIIQQEGSCDGPSVGVDPDMDEEYVFMGPLCIAIDEETRRSVYCEHSGISALIESIDPVYGFNLDVLSPDKIG